MITDRQDIATRWVREEQRDEAYEQVRAELRRGRQAYVICPMVAENEAGTAARSAEEEARRLGHNFVRNRFAFPRTRIVPHQCFRSLVSQVGTEQILLGLVGESTGTLGGFSEGR